MTSSDMPASTTPPALTEDNTSWQIKTWERGGLSIANLPALAISIDLDAHTISGFSGCNSFGGSFTIENEEISVEQLRSTQRGCDQSTMEQESQFLRVIQAVRQIRIEQNQLILSSTVDQTENTLYFSRL